MGFHAKTLPSDMTTQGSANGVVLTHACELDNSIRDIMPHLLLFIGGRGLKDSCAAVVRPAAGTNSICWLKTGVGWDPIFHFFINPLNILSTGTHPIYSGCVQPGAELRSCTSK